MTGTEIFIVGGLLLCNIGTLAWLLKSNPKSDKPTPPEVNSEEVSPASESLEELIKQSIEEALAEKEEPQVNKGVDIDKALEELSNKFMDAIPRLLTAAIGDVNINDVIFGKTEEEEEDETPATESKLNPGQVDAAFETDIRDVESQPPSAPETGGHTMEELEKSVETAMDSNATDEEKAAAGKVLKEYEGTQVFDVMRSNDEISRRVDICLTMALKLQIQEKEAKPTPKPKPTPQKPNEAKEPKPKRKEAKVNLKSVDLDSFNPADLLKK